MSNDEPDFGEPSSPFESLPPKASTVPAQPGDEVELALIGAVLGDPDGQIYAVAKNLPAAAFLNPEARKIWEALQDGVRIDDTLKLIEVTRLPFTRIAELCQMDRLGTLASMHTAELWRRHRLRLKEELARRIAEANTIEPEEWKRLIDGLAEGSELSFPARSLSEFGIPKSGDRSILLGDRYLNRGDGGVLVSTSGVGKSSMSLQAASKWALGQDFFGIKPNGELRSLIIQSEDSDGDIGEVWFSLQHCLELSLEEREKIGRNVLLVTNRVHRGAAFVAELRKLIRLHKPDLVWVNPLQAFIDGDVTDSQDLGAFLREGLNSLNEPASFGYIVVHHTTKPPQPGQAADLKWYEQMYQMAGGAEIINWARFIMSLRPTDEEGKFNLVLAKRGRRAGVTKKVEQGAGFRDEPVTSIALQHSHEHVEVHGRKMPIIFWESSDHDPKPKKAPANKNPFGPTVDDLMPVLKVPAEKAVNVAFIRRAMAGIRPMTPTRLFDLLAEGVAEGRIVKVGSEREPAYYAK